MLHFFITKMSLYSIDFILFDHKQIRTISQLALLCVFWRKNSNKCLAISTRVELP